MRKDVNTHSAHRDGDNATPPKRFAEPVTDFDRAAKDVLLQKEADAADGFAINDDGKAGHGIFRTGVLNPPLRIIKRIRMWKAVAHIAPDLRIIGVARERFFVAAPPVTNQEVA